MTADNSLDNKIEKIGNVVLDLGCYHGDDAYSDGDIEEKLLSLVKSGEDLNDVLRRENEWPVLYHLSDIRENLLSWYDFPGGGSCLEIGAGCGAVTGVLTEKCSHVTAVELSRRRSLINAWRHRECDNLEIIVGNFEDVCITGKYDYVTLIGVLEYAAYYLHDPDPFSAMLKKARSYLKEDGTLILAIENKYGLKYWAGTAEDHTGEYFDGVTGYPRGQKSSLLASIRTFSRKHLKDLIREAGFENSFFYYPFPDYKLPTEIYSEEKLPSPGSLQGMAPSFALERLVLFDEEKAADSLLSDGMYADFANSYLVFCGRKKPEQIYAKYNSLRRPLFRTSTCMEGKTAVVKTARSPGAVSHLRSISANYGLIKDLYRNIRVVPPLESNDKRIVFPYLDGSPLIVHPDYDREDMDAIFKELSGAAGLVTDFKEEYLVPFEETKAFTEVFGRSGECFESCKAVRICNFDTIFDNFIVTEDGICCIDYEWVFPFPVPTDFLRFRALSYFYDGEKRYLETMIDKESFLMHFGFSEDQIRVLADMEYHFQEYVYGNDFSWVYTERYKKSGKSLEEYIAYQRELEGQLSLKDTHIGNLTDTVAVKERQLADQESTIQNLGDQVRSKDQHIGNLEGIIENLEGEVGSLEGEAGSLRGQVQDLEIQKDSLENQVGGLEGEIRNLNGYVEDLKEKISFLESEKDAVQKTLEDQQAALTELRGKEVALQNLEASLGNPRFLAGQAVRMAAQKMTRISHRIRENSPGYKARIARREEERLVREAGRTSEYEKWIESVEENDHETMPLSYEPKISVLVPVYNVEDRHLIPCIESVLNQTYRNFELCMADDCSTWPNVRRTLEKYEKDPRVKVIYRKKNGHISECTNTALSAADGEYAGLLDCDDILSPNALYEMAKLLNEDPSLDFIYSDEDKVDDDGLHRHMPHFKPDWSPDTLMSHMYTCHFTIYRRSLLLKAKGLRSEFNGSQDYDLAVRISEMTDNIGHIPKILYHWRERAESTSGNAGAKPYVYEAARKAKLEALSRRGFSGNVVSEPATHQYNVVYDPPTDAVVSIIIPSKDHPDILERCVSSLVKLTGWKRYEILLVDNGSSPDNREKYESLAECYKIKYLYHPMAFNFSAMCNMGAREASGDYLLFLNDDMEILEENWLSVMLGHAALPYAGCVGAKLLYPETGMIQHAGVINIDNGPCHAFSGMSDEQVYYFGRNRLVYNVLAVTAACLLVGREKFYRAGGFCEDLAVAYNDVDFCMKILELGYYNVVRTDVKLLHYESVSRGNDALDTLKMRRLMDEQDALYKRHPSYARKDPFYSPMLSQNSIDFSCAFQKDQMIINQVVKTGSLPGSLDVRKVRYAVDSAFAERYVVVEGWAFLGGYLKNDDLKVSVVLSGETGDYIADTVKVYRPDVVSAFPDEREISYAGFRTRIERKDLPDGDYRVLVMLSEGRKFWRKDTGRILSK